MAENEMQRLRREKAGEFDKVDADGNDKAAKAAAAAKKPAKSDDGK